MSLIKMKLFLVVFLIVYHRNAEGYLNQNYVNILTGKILSEHFSNITSKTLLECAGECVDLVPKGTCNLAAFNKSSNKCLLGSQGVGQIQDVLDGNSIVMVFYELCGLSETPVHGSVVYSANRETAQFTCDPGYLLSGNTFISCNNGEWVGTVPICVDIDECGSNPCLNGATCVNGIGMYRCKCAVGFTGTNCEIDINECGSNPCLNGATCVNGIGMYTCTCAIGFTGINCQTDINECGSNPCLHGATCVNGIGMYTCTCAVGYAGINCEIVQSPNHDCCDVRANNPSAPSGIYQITMMDNTVVSVYCDMVTTCGGWTVIQNRFDGSVNFTQTFANYEFGFGSLAAEHWLGLRYIQEIASYGPTILRMDLEAADGTVAYEQHTNFHLSSAPNYAITLDAVGTGTAGYDPGMSYNNGQNFYTIDRENTYNCAHMDYGGWWYLYCTYDNLNGRYMPPGDTSLSEGGVTYRSFRNVESLRRTKMMISRCCV